MGTPSVYCKKCCTKITGKYYRTTEGHDFHEHCLRCKDCYTTMQWGKFYFRDGEYYCQKDYAKRFMLKCFSCEKFIKNGKYYRVSNKNYHSGCFRCSKCSVLILDKYYNISGTVQCTNCGKDENTDLVQLLLGLGIEHVGFSGNPIMDSDSDSDEDEVQKSLSSPGASTSENSKVSKNHDIESKSKQKELSSSETRKSKSQKLRNSAVGMIRTCFIKSCELLL